MGFRINTNIAAMNAHRNATMNNVGLDKSLSALSSGLRVSKAADDSAGLAIANKLSAQSNTSAALFFVIITVINQIFIFIIIVQIEHVVGVTLPSFVVVNQLF